MIVGSDQHRWKCIHRPRQSQSQPLEKSIQETASTRGRTYVECVVGGLDLHGVRHIECLARCEFGGYRRSSKLLLHEIFVHWMNSWRGRGIESFLILSYSGVGLSDVEPPGSPLWGGLGLSHSLSTLCPCSGQGATGLGP